MISDSLRFSKHVDSIVTKANFRANLILWSFSTNDLLTLSALFKVYVRPLLEYATQVWAPCDPNSDVHTANVIENVQRRFTKRIFFRIGITNLSYEERLEVLQLKTLELRRLYSDLDMVYCIVYNLIDLPFEEFFSLSAANGRLRTNHDLTLTMPTVHKSMNKYFFACRTINLWNNLPSYIVMAPSFEIFKSRLREFEPDRILFTSLLR